MRVVAMFGLGNPGRKYLRTRHNIGFMVLDRLADRAGVDFCSSKFQAEIAEHRTEAVSGPGAGLPLKVLLAKPQTYMNESGRAVGGLGTFYDVDLDDVLVICDDLDLPLGRIRLKPKGGSGGQKGLKSIAQHLSSQDFARLRIGIGRDDDLDASDYVLRPFAVAERETVDEVLERAADAAHCWLTDGVTAAMNRFNVNPRAAESAPTAKGESGSKED